MGDASYPGEDLLRGKSSREILERLVDGDPLELEARCRERIEASALLLDPSRVHLRAVARVARTATGWHGKPPLHELITERIEYSMRELIDEDQEADRSGIPNEEPEDPRYAYLSEVLGIEPLLVRRACVAFNRLPHEVRSAWFAVFVLGKTVARHVAEGNGSENHVLRRIELATQAISDAIGRRLEHGEGGIHG